MLPEECRGALPPTSSMTPTILTSLSVNEVRQGWICGGLRPFLGPLELAIAVFKLPNNPKVLVARDACHAWKEVGPLEFSTKGSEAVVRLLNLADLDPKTTTAVEFDAMNLRFSCLNCYPANDESWTGITAETWRSAVRIFILICHHLILPLTSAIPFSSNMNCTHQSGLIPLPVGNWSHPWSSKTSNYENGASRTPYTHTTITGTASTAELSNGTITIARTTTH